MQALMHIFLQSPKPEVEASFNTSIQTVYQHGVTTMSISPMRDIGQFGEIYLTLEIDNLKELMAFLSSGWDETDEGRYETSYIFYQLYDENINSIYLTMID